MHRVLALVAVALLGVGVVACGGKDKVVKVVKPKKEKDGKAYLADAREAAQSGNLVDADKAYAKSYELSKEFDTLQEHVDFLILNGKPTKAIEVAKVYYDANVTSTRGYQLYCEALLAGHKGEEALNVADSIIAANAGDAAGHEKRGRALLLLERNDEGVEELRKAVQLDQEKSADFLLQLGIGLDKIKKGDDAALKFRAALKRKPDDPTILTYLGMALRNQGELDESKKYLEKAIQLDPQYGRAYFELGLLHNVQQNQSDAQQALEKAVQKSPNESKFYYALGEIYKLQEQYDKAIKAYKLATELDPPYPKASGKLGILYADAKRYDEAESLLIPAVRREPKNPVHYFYLGLVYAAKNQKKFAIDNYEAFLKLAPKNDPDIRRARAAIADLKRR